MADQNSIVKLLGNSAIPEIIRRLWGNNIRFVLVMHGIASRKYQELDNEAQPCLTKSDLSKILLWLSTRYNFLSPVDFFTSQKPGVLLTFDDGYANNYINALPILEEYSAHAIFFVTIQHIIEPMNWLPSIIDSIKNSWGSSNQVPKPVTQDIYSGMSLDQLKECSKHALITIGSHSISHPFLTSCSGKQLDDEITGSKLRLEHHLQTTVDFFAYPTGDYDSRVVDAVRKAGYKAAFASDTKNLASPHFEIPRVGLYQSDDYYLSLKLCGLHRRPLKATPVFQSDIADLY